MVTNGFSILRCAGRSSPWSESSACLLRAFLLYPLLGKSYFPRTDPGQFVINIKAPPGTRLELTEDWVAKVENIVREVVPKHELKIIVSNMGITPGFSSILTPNSCPSTAFVQVGLEEGHRSEHFRLHGPWFANV